MTPSGRTITRVEVKLGDLGQVAGEPGDAQQQGIAQRRGAGRVLQQRWRGADAADQVLGVGVGERGEAGRMVGEHAGGDAAEPEHHHRAEHRLLRDAGQCLDAVGDHGLDQHPGHPPGEPGAQPVHRGAYLFGAVQLQFDGADRALVQQAGHVGLEYHVTAQPGRCCHGRAGTGGPAELQPRAGRSCSCS